MSFYCPEVQPPEPGTVADCLRPLDPDTSPGSGSGSGSSRRKGNGINSANSGGGGGSGGVGVGSFRCFTSRDSNWSLNAVLVHRTSMLHQVLGTKKARKRWGLIGGCSCAV